MKIVSTYSVKIKHYNKIFSDTVKIYRGAVDFLISVCNDNYDVISHIEGQKLRKSYVESLIHRTKDNPHTVYDFDDRFYKFPSYLRRSAISEALGRVSSYRSNLKNWEQNKDGREPSVPKAGFAFPAMYRDNMYVRTGTYTAKIKIYIRNTWDYINISLKKSDVDYIEHHCAQRKHCVPTLVKRGKQWFLDFVFEENVKLEKTDVTDRLILAVDLGINTPATVSVMKSDGTILGRHFCKLNEETDRLTHGINRIKKAQQHGNRKMPRLWNRVKGINHDISVKTAEFIMGIAVLYSADVIVFEHLDKRGKVRGSKKQRLKLWRSQEVQRIVSDKAHRLGMRISHVNAWGTSRLAFDGSGRVLRGREAGFSTYELCMFPNGKIYNCDLSASYNIGARYFIREILKSAGESLRLRTLAKVPQCSKRSTCTLSTLISLNAVLASS